MSELDQGGKLDWQETFLDGSFASAKKGGDGVGKTKRGKGTKWMVVVAGAGVPLGSQFTSALPAEVKLAESTLDAIAVPRKGRGRPQKRPWRVIAGRAYDSDPLRWRLCQRGLLLIAPHRKTGARPRSTMAARCAAIANAGKSNAPLPGWATSAVWWCATTGT